ncbi:MAG: hypothetical protein ACYSSO_11715 [Planctomycetota bacterium]|jgi:hypothetical protein
MDKEEEYKEFLEHLLTYTYNRLYSIHCRIIYDEINEFIERQNGARGET